MLLDSYTPGPRAETHRVTLGDSARMAGLPVADPGPDPAKIARGLGRLLHVDDVARISGWQCWLQGQGDLDWGTRAMLLTTLLGREAAEDLEEGGRALFSHPAMVQELLQLLGVIRARLAHQTLPLSMEGIPLRIHGSYRLNEVMSALRDVRSGGLYLPREGVHFDKKNNCNLLFVTLHKDEDDYSPSTLYADYALGPQHFHWQSQSGTRATDKKGQRHLKHAELGITPLLFVRPTRQDDRGESQAYTLLGPVTLDRWQGERPMNIAWRLQVPMPAELLRQAKVVA